LPRSARCRAGLLWLLAGAWPAASGALELGGVQIHGFVTQGLFHTSHNRQFGHSDQGVSPDFTEVGLNGSWSPLPRLRLSLQLLSRWAGAGHEGSPQVDFGLLDYAPIDSEDYRFGFRLGRVRIPYGLYNDTRDVAFTRPSILLPQSIYPERTRDYTLSADGGVLYGELRGGFGSVLAEFMTAVPRTDDRATELAILGRRFPGHLDAEPVFIGRLAYESPEGGLRLAVTAVDASTRYRPLRGESPELRRATDVFTPWVFSAQYQTERWTFTSEYSLRPIKKDGFGLPFDYSIHGEGYYFQAAYRFAPKWEAMVRYDALYNDRDDPYGYQLEKDTGGAVAGHSQFAQDWTVGLRYDITPSIMARAEYHAVTGSAWLPQQDNPDPEVIRKHWDMFAVLVSFRF
jgi:hypothetical protein